ncbi:hypothetical protein [Rahnella inusitata]|uniref:hypothetical protein n=1 Tax=Rahnella inusitata TaxID=58169 RepID=UPI001BC83936|nr:hypothetical protein [Rahnella inusitata]QUT13791.1 hypothetical protein I2123_13795 [Rahnella inusitata]
MSDSIQITLQEPGDGGIKTTYSNGYVEVLPYSVDENGDKYVELFPKDIALN